MPESVTQGFISFLEGEIARRQMTARQFAIFIDVDPTTVTRALDKRHPRRPGLDFLLALAEKTRTPLSTLIDVAYPEVANNLPPSPSAQLLAEQIERLPEQYRRAIDALIRGALINDNDPQGGQ
jgi:hypothetical protein